MGDYTEHLISMAGGDGDDALGLDAIQARADANNLWNGPEDRVHLLTIVRGQRERIERCKALLDEAIEEHSYGGGIRHSDLEAIRAALTATDEQ